MQARVTAVLVAHNGGGRLPRTLDALRGQTRQPDSLVVVDVASGDDSASLLTEMHPTGFLSASTRLPFGTAVSHALGVVSPPQSEDEWLWLLAHDSAPAPDALAALLAAVEVNPSVAAAGPKQMEWDEPQFIAGFGESVTRFGAGVPLVERELDQGQHERMSDVLGIAAGGLLVRHTVWNDLGGFDPALPTADNALDFSIRVRLAGHRVIAVPAARVATSGDGYSGPGTSTRGGERRRRQTTRRAAQLHRRLVYAPAFAVLFHWLSLVPLAVARTFFQVLRKQPGAVAGEFAAAFRTAFGGRVGEARRKIRSTKKVGWSAVAPLRVPGAEVRRRNALVRELALSRARGARGALDELQFFTGGGAPIVAAAAVVSAVLFFPLFRAEALVGGSLLPLSGSPGGLWANVGYGWRDLGLGFVGASDPFAYVLSILGSITFWSPSIAIVALYLLALPLAALAAWFCAAKLTTRAGLRAFAAILWTIAPPFLGSMDAGQLGAILAHLLLPWLLLAALSAARSWSASAIASLVFAALVSAAPSLWPALLVMWLGAVVFSRRAVARYIGIPIPAIVLAAPLAYEQFMRGTPLAFFADPGLPNAHGPVSLVDLLLGLPESGIAGWSSIGSSVGIDPSAIELTAVILLLPLGLIAVAALFLPRPGRAVVGVSIAILGFATAFASTLVTVASTGSAAVSIWPASGQSLYWLGIVGAATVGLSTFTRLASIPAIVSVLAIAVLAVPVATSTLVGTSDVRASTGEALPAFVTAEAAGNPRVGTLVLTPLASGALSAAVVHGDGATLDTQSTLDATNSGLSPTEAQLADLVGNLASRSGTDASVGLTDLGVEFVVLAPASGASASMDAAAVVARTVSSFDANASLTPIGQTFAGELWQITGSEGFSALPEPSPANTGTSIGLLILIFQAIVFGLTLLLALPAGRLEAHGARAATAVDEVPEPVFVDEEELERLREREAREAAERESLQSEDSAGDVTAGGSGDVGDGPGLGDGSGGAGVPARGDLVGSTTATAASSSSSSSSSSSTTVRTSGELNHGE